MIKNFAVFPNKKAEGKQPPYRVTHKDDDGNYHELGAGWKNESNNGTFIGVQLKKNYEKDDAKYPGYVIITEDEYKAFQELRERYKKDMKVDGNQPDNFPDDDFKPEDIDF